ncbi:hypothetical protein D9M71_357860 [compost metagenome]
MVGYTQGPWTLETVRTSSGICHKIGPFPPKSHHVHSLPRHACLYGDYPSPFDPADQELEANARLISCAPELLEALECVLALHDNAVYFDDPWQVSMESARAIIAKAKGEQA